MSPTADTIAAIATPPGRGGVGIVRVSGPAAREIAERLLGHCPPPRHACYLPFRDAEGRVLDQGIALFFSHPHSYTGEDVLELQGHGGPVVLDLLLDAVLTAGARAARPGEFSERAFLNGKLDLAQAEAVADLIEAGSREAARLALRSLQGAFSSRVHQLVETFTALRTYVEASIDFSDEDIDFLGEGDVAGRVERLLAEVGAVREAARQGTVMREGITVVIAGRPNAGKSSLLNALAGREAAIVTEIPGTTRDVLREHIAIDGVPLHVVDTAGLRDSEDRVEREGIRRAWGELEKADRILLVVDDATGIAAEERAILERLPHIPVTVVRNKIDLSGNPPALRDGEVGPELRLSARSGIGLDLLRDHLKQTVGWRDSTEGLFMARRRHLDALDRVAAHLTRGSRSLRDWRAGELLAEELRLAQQALGEITGEVTSDDLLGRIFSSFCIGK
ncbi:MAG: tRNA uridine-5-carboxymethylaminomethyl(34) synthesis GTPase MnmE [Thiohalomonadaceae bacterium]